MELTGLVVVILACLLPSIQSEIILESENVTHWGEWGPWDSCPKGAFASSFRLKTEPHPTSVKLDDTGLNAIELFCTKPESSDKLGGITSSEGDYGDWGIKFRCNSGHFIEGFQLRVLPPQGGFNSGSYTIGLRDDYGATNLRIFCGGDSEPLEGDGLDKGEWGRKMKCLDNQHICAIRTQVEFAEERPKSFWNKIVDERWIGFGDYTGLNNVRMKCCDIPNPGATCKPTDGWEKVLSCDATFRTSPINCRFDKKVGVSERTAASSGSVASEGMANSGSKGMGIAVSALSANFGENYSKSKSTGHDWRHETSGTWTSETTTDNEFVVQPGQRSELEQLVGRCGEYLVRTTNFKITDYDREGNLLG